MLSNVNKNTLYHLDLQDYYIGAITSFQHQVDVGILAIGIFDKAEAAEDMIDYIQHLTGTEDENSL